MEKKTSVSFDSDIHVSFSKRFFPHLIALFFAVMGCMLTIQDTLAIPMGAISIIAMIGFPWLFTALYTMKKSGMKIVLALIALFGLGLFFILEMVMDALNLLNANFLSGVNKYYFTNYSYLKPTFYNQEYMTVTTVIMVSIAFVLSVIFGLLIVRGKRELILLALFAPFAYLAMNFTDTPLYMPLAFLLLSFMATFTMCHSMSMKKAEGRNGDFVKLKQKKMAYWLSNKEIKGKTLLSGSVTVMVIILASSMMLSLVVPRNSYEPKQYAKLYLKNMIEKINEGDAFNFSLDKASGGISNGVIGGVDKIEYNNRLHVKVKTDHQVPMYLKGYVGSLYKNNGWHDLNEGAIQDGKKIFKQFQQEGYTSQMAGIPFQQYLMESPLYGKDFIVENNMIIENVGPQKNILLLPYHFYQAPDIMTDKNYLLDGQITRTQNIGKPYQVSSFLHKSMKNQHYTPYSSRLQEITQADIDEYNRLGNGKLIELEKMYQSYVLDNYTRLPSYDNFNNIITTFESFWSQYKEPMTIDQAVDAVKEYMFKHAEYSLEPGKTPANEDFIDYFLFGSRKGYCSHFATTATVMLRAGGIPARYVEGYVITQKDYDEAKSNNIDTVQIRDTNAHAWVEVYEPYIGWVPFEVTPGYSVSQVAMSNLNDIPSPPPPQEIVDDVEVSSSEVPSSEVISSETSSEVSSEQTSEETSETSLESKTSSLSSKPTITSSETDGTVVFVQSSNNYSRQILAILIYILIILIIFSLIIWLRRVVVLSKRKRAFSNNNMNEATLASYEYILKMLAYFGFYVKDHENMESFAKAVEKKCKFIYKSKLEEMQLMMDTPNDKLQKLLFIERKNELHEPTAKVNIEKSNNILIRKGEFKEATDIAQKARFSQHTVTLEEKQKVEQVAERLKLQIYQYINPFKKFDYKWIRVLK